MPMYVIYELMVNLSHEMIVVCNMGLPDTSLACDCDFRERNNNPKSKSEGNDSC